jgi:hypothetical protein
VIRNFLGVRSQETRDKALPKLGNDLPQVANLDLQRADSSVPGVAIGSTVMLVIRGCEEGASLILAKRVQRPI